MTILESMAQGHTPGPVVKKRSLTKMASLVTLTFQNSALILIMHYSRVAPPSGDHRYFTSTAILLTELIKLSISLTLALYESSKTLAPDTPASVLLEQVWDAVVGGDGWKLALPAVGYTVQSMLQYQAVENLDAVHFQVLYQLKILITALLSVSLLNRPLSLRRWISLIVLTLGVSIVSVTSSPPSSLLFNSVADHFFPRSLHEISAPADIPAPGGAHLSRRSATYEGIDADQPLVQPDGANADGPLMNYSLGVSSVLVAAAVSGLTGVYFEKVLKQSPTQASVWVRNIQLSLYSILSALLFGILYQDGAGIAEHGFFEGYSWSVWAAIGLQACGGLIGSLVIRDADNIVKSFATGISIVISFLVSVWAFDFPVTLTFITGTALVLGSTYVYSLPDRPLHRRPPPIRIASFEKPTIEALNTPGTTPRVSEKGALNLNPFDKSLSPAGGVGVSSSRPASPMLTRSVSRGNIKREE